MPPTSPPAPPPPAHAAAYAGEIFGPFRDPRLPDPIVRQTSQIIDLLGASDWIQVLRAETAPFKWGQLVIYAETTTTQPTFPTGLSLDSWPWVEIRVIATVESIPFVWFEGGAGNHDAEAAFSVSNDPLAQALSGGEDVSPGPIVLPFRFEEVPDVLEVYARPRSGPAIGAGPVCASINVQASTRFRP